MKIYVYNNPNTGVCDIAKHFEDNWNNLHPKASEVSFEIYKKAYINAIQVTDNNGEVVYELNEGDALRLDVLQEYLINNL